jgi:hypothetical protein
LTVRFDRELSDETHQPGTAVDSGPHAHTPAATHLDQPVVAQVGVGPQNRVHVHTERFGEITRRW